ncbi:hypothetical protein [Costertonia aggregata]|uniref:Carboxypeptidase regulatory-like domain-containing protein n=1 Tax=Costertonia aggregata TaxID=343403 RepID=A0A7H9AR99_9FLAO|nr:hypothetical protein [Costertonia aggregata]QLG45960.1 hypothetical protein HYG79_11590 [Costertonia aggregata]
MNKVSCSLLFVCLLQPLVFFSQKSEKAPINALLSEKIYLQLSSKTYSTDQIIWFKAIVLDEKEHLPSKLSGILYVDFIGPNGKIQEHKLVKISNGIGKGFFELRDDHVQGRYLIRAYTQWNLNFGNDFVFSTYIDIYGNATAANYDFFENLTVSKKDNGDLFLTGKLGIVENRDKPRKQVKVYLDWGKGKDTVTLRKEKLNDYILQYQIKKKINRIKLTLDDESDFYPSKTFFLKDSLPDIQFFPESGQFVHGFRNTIGFKAVDFEGKGVAVRGEVLDSFGNRITNFESNRLGMGVFSIKADSSNKYYAKISLQANKSNKFTYPIPKVVPRGSILSIEKAKDTIRIKVATNEIEGHVLVKASCRGTDYYLIDGPLRKGYMISELPSAVLPEGIIVFTLMNSKKVPIAERLYFNHAKKDRLDIALDIDKNVYKRRENTKLKIDFFGDNSPQPNTNISVMVVKKEHWDLAETGNIQSYFLLDSELKGKIEEPGHYFDKKNQDRFQDLNALLLTQGWRNYKYPIKRSSGIFYWPQTGLAVKGIVQSTVRNKKDNQPIDIAMATFGKEMTIYTQQTDTMGRFNFSLSDSYGQRMRILLNAKNTITNKTNYHLSLNSSHSTPKIIYEISSKQKQSKVSKAVIAAKENRAQANAVFDSLYGVTQLEEVTVEDYGLTPERKQVYEQFGKPDVVIRGETLRKQEEKWSYGLYSVLLFNYANQIEIERFSDGFMLAHVVGGRGEPTLLAVDGKLITKEQYEFIPNMPLNTIEDVEIVKYAKFFKTKYLTVFPETDVLEAPGLGHIISIYTRGGVGLHSTGKPRSGTLEASIDVFSPVREFYAPKYGDITHIKGQQPDLRSLVYWNPSISLGKNVDSPISFYNCDIAGEYIIIVEAVSEDGRIGYVEKTYRVAD